MSSTIHLQSEIVQDLCDLLKRSAEDIYDMTSQLKAAIQRIDWEGPGQPEFMSQANQMVTALKQGAADLDVLGLSAWREVDQWLWMDQQGVTRFKGSSSASHLTPFIRGYGDATAVHPNDLRQGQVGDCFLLAPLAAIAARDPSFIEKMIKDNGNGTYTVTFYHNGKPTYITVSQTDLTAQLGLSNDGKWMERADIGDITRTQRETWVQIVESAYAKWKGGFPKIDEGGFAFISFPELTGKQSSVRIPALSSFNDLAETFEKGYPITASSLPEISIDPKQIDLGITTVTTPKIQIFDPDWVSSHYEGELVNNHVYYITGVDRINQTVIIRNPWGWNETDLTIPYDDFKNSFSSFEFSPI